MWIKIRNWREEENVVLSLVDVINHSSFSRGSFAASVGVQRESNYSSLNIR